MDDKTNKLIREILLDKFGFEITEEEVWHVLDNHPLLLCHIIKEDHIEFEFKFREYQEEYGTNLIDATAKFSAKDTPIEPIFTGKWKLV